MGNSILNPLIKLVKETDFNDEESLKIFNKKSYDFMEELQSIIAKTLTIQEGEITEDQLKSAMTALVKAHFFNHNKEIENIIKEMGKIEDIKDRAPLGAFFKEACVEARTLAEFKDVKDTDNQREARKFLEKMNERDFANAVKEKRDNKIEDLIVDIDEMLFSLQLKKDEQKTDMLEYKDQDDYLEGLQAYKDELEIKFLQNHIKNAREIVMNEFLEFLENKAKNNSNEVRPSILTSFESVREKEITAVCKGVEEKTQEIFSGEPILHAGQDKQDYLSELKAYWRALPEKLENFGREMMEMASAFSEKTKQVVKNAVESAFSQLGKIFPNDFLNISDSIKRAEEAEIRVKPKK